MNHLLPCFRPGLLFPLLIATSSGAVVPWTGGGADNLISTAANWGGTIPTIANGNSGQIGAVTVRGDLPAAMELVLNNTTWAKEGTSGAARDVDLVGGSKVTFNTGSFATDRHSWWRGGLYTANGLLLTVPSDWRLRDGCTVFWNSGTANVGGFTDDGTGGLTFNLAAGEISASTYTLTGSSRINFTGPRNGVLVAKSTSYTSTFQSMIDSGKIVIDGAQVQASAFTIQTIATETRLSITPQTVAIDFDDTTFSVSEASTTGYTVGTVAATSTPPGAVFTYAITGGNFQNDFSIEPTTGVIKVASTLNYSEHPVYPLTIVASTGGNQSATATATVTVGDAQAVVDFDNTTFSLTEAAAMGTTVGTVAATSTEPGSAFTYQIINGNFENDFTIDPATGVIKVAGTLSYSGIPTYLLAIQASDGHGHKATATVTVNVQLPMTTTTQWATGASNSSIVTASNWNNGLPSRSPLKPGVLNNGDIAKVVNRDDLYSKDLVLNGNAKLTGGFRFGGAGGASITLNDSSSWTTTDLEFGRNANAPTSIQVNGANASLTVTGEILSFGSTYHTTPIFQRGGTTTLGSFSGGKPVLHLLGGTCISNWTDIYVNFWPGSTGIYRAPVVQGLTVDSHGIEWDDELYPYGANSYDFAKYYLISMWDEGKISVAGQWGVPFDQVFLYTPGAGITLLPGAPLTTDGSRPLHLDSWVLNFNELSGGVPYIKWLVDNGKVTWELGERMSPVGTGTILHTWTNAQGVKLFLSDKALWAESEGSKDSPLYLPYLASHGINGPGANDQGANYDNDNMDNLAEFAFGGNPNVDDSATRAPKIVLTPGPNGPKYSFNYFRRYDAEDVGLSYQVQMSPNLTTWTDIGPTTLTGAGSLFESVSCSVQLPQAFFRIILQLNPTGKESVPSEKSITVPRIYNFENEGVMPRGDVDLRSPWIHIVKSVAGPYSFRLSQDPSFQTGVLQSQPQKWKFWNPWQDLAVGTWHWQWGTGPAGSIQWDPTVYTFNIISAARSVPMPPTAEQMVAIIKNRQLPVINCNPDQVGQLQNVLSTAERTEFLREATTLTYPKLPPVAMTLNPSSYSSRTAFENAIRSHLSNKFYYVMRLSRAYAIFGQQFTSGGTTYYPKAKALEYLVAIKQNYDTLQWTHDWGSGPQTVTVAAAAADFGGSLGVASYLCDVLDLFENDLDPASVTLFAGIAKLDYCKNSLFVGAEDFLTGNMPIASNMFDRFEHTYWDQHWAQIYILQPCTFLPILMRYHPDLEESFKWSYNVYLYRGTMGGRNDGSWTDGNAYLGASLTQLVNISSLYSRLTNYTFNYFNYNEWFRNFPRYIYFSSPPGSNHGGTFTDGVGWDPSGGSHNELAQIIHAFDPSTPVAKWNIFRRLGAGGRDIGRIDWVFERTSDALRIMSLLSAFEHFGRYVPDGNETPPGELARDYPDTGLVTMHTDHRVTANDFYVNFKSSPYGAQNHTHPAQNAFNIGFGGKDLFWHTGYYNTGPYPFHDRLDYKSTWGHNAILPNKVTQLFESNQGYGWLPRYVHGDKITYALGDATMAYPTRDRSYPWGSPKLNEFGYGYPEVQRMRRHVMMLRPSHLVIYDELEAKHPIPWMYLLQSRTNQNMTKRGNGWITAYNTISTGNYGIGNFKLFCNAPFTTEVTNYFRHSHPNEFDDKYPDGYQRHHHGYLETTGKHEKMRFLSVVAVSKSTSPATVPAEITGSTTPDGLFTVQLGNYTVKAQLDGNKAPYLEARNADQTAALVTGANVQNITLNGVTNQATLRGSTLLMERGTYRGDIFVQEADKFPDAFRFGNKYD